MEPEFTVLIASHKREDMLGQALSSLESQTIDHRKFEAVVVKDYQISGEILENRSFQIRVFDSDIQELWKKHLIGVSNAQGKYICFLDDDDLFSRFKLERLSALLTKDSADFIVNSKGFFNHKETPEDIQSIKENDEQVYEVRDDIPRNLFAKIPWYNCSSMTIRTDIAKRYVHLIDGITREIDPFWFLVGLESASIIIYDQNKLTLYRRHEGGVSRSNDIEKLCNYAQSAITNLSKMNNYFKARSARLLIGYNLTEWKAKSLLLGCVDSTKEKITSIISLVRYIQTFSKKWIFALITLLLISMVSVQEAREIYPKFFR